MACKAAEILKCCGFQALRGWLFPRSPARPGPRGDEMRREVLVPGRVHEIIVTAILMISTGIATRLRRRGLFLRV